MRLTHAVIRRVAEGNLLFAGPRVFRAARVRNMARPYQSPVRSVHLKVIRRVKYKPTDPDSEDEKLRAWNITTQGLLPISQSTQSLGQYPYMG